MSEPVIRPCEWLRCEGFCREQSLYRLLEPGFHEPSERDYKGYANGRVENELMGEKVANEEQDGHVADVEGVGVFAQNDPQPVDQGDDFLFES